MGLRMTIVSSTRKSLTKSIVLSTSNTSLYMRVPLNLVTKRNLQHGSSNVKQLGIELQMHPIEHHIPEQLPFEGS